ncbi:MBL fold metallo-hydrolase [Kitasatospora sp. NPDC096147]|uniref:MBL fold metallo-hydrolase n=1 Tax=Kitasatospora sp. NPDC096147 TaxID=3364093 RepID=UPI00381BBFAC
MSIESAPRILLGDVEAIRIVEYRGPFRPAAELVPQAPAALWREHADRLAPDHWDPATDMAVMALQTWVLRSGGRTVVVDTGVGDGRERPDAPQFHRRQGRFLELLAEAGIRPEEVDTVVNTHLHADHVGWNTRWEDGSWVPTFPNAEYLLHAADHTALGPDNDYGQGASTTARLLYEDSIAPVRRAGQLVLWDGRHAIDRDLVLEPAPGHTPGSAVLRLTSGGERAVFVGDLVHSPVQILEPAHNSCFCQDPAAAAASRRRILERAADLRELVFPAHLSGPGATEVRRHGSGFTLAPHTPFETTGGTGRP